LIHDTSSVAASVVSVRYASGRRHGARRGRIVAVSHAAAVASQSMVVACLPASCSTVAVSRCDFSVQAWPSQA